MSTCQRTPPGDNRCVNETPKIPKKIEVSLTLTLLTVPKTKVVLTRPLMVCFPPRLRMAPTAMDSDPLMLDNTASSRWLRSSTPGLSCLNRSGQASWRWSGRRAGSVYASTVYGNSVFPGKNSNTVDVDSVDTGRHVAGPSGEEIDS
jgi:hypothetical protein